MIIEDKIRKIKDKIKGKITFNEKLSKLSWFNLGGPAKVLFRPENLSDLSFFLKNLNNKLPIKVLGRGSNTLIRDGGFNGVIIKFGKAFSHISLLKKDILIAGSSALDKSVSQFAMENSLAGLEFLSCIPGTIGGAIKMNSGCYNNDLSKILLSVQAMDLQGNVQIIPSSKINFKYRGSDLKEDLIFISASLKGRSENKKTIEEKINKFIKQKKLTQPSNIKTCGSTFKNPNTKDNKKAWELIKKAGGEKMSYKGAIISKKHYNFFVNEKCKKANELETLISDVKTKVFNKTGVNLELEVQIIGEK